MAEPSATRHLLQFSADSWLRTLPSATRFIFQGGPQARAAVGDAFGVRLSENACRANAQGDRAALWLGPDEYLLLAPAQDAEKLTSTLQAALAAVAHSLVDISHRQVALQVSGPQATAILNSGCPLDLDLTAFPTGMCTRTLLAKTEIVLWRKGADEFQIEVWRSFSDYAVRWMMEAARDFATAS
ncbi:MAG: sarcosine oxidase subunit gamma [Steroidobacteraceae bacterium]